MRIANVVLARALQVKMSLATTGVRPRTQLISFSFFFCNIFSVAIESLLKDRVLRFRKIFRKHLCCKVSVIYDASVATKEAALSASGYCSKT